MYSTQYIVWNYSVIIKAYEINVQETLYFVLIFKNIAMLFERYNWKGINVSAERVMEKISKSYQTT